MDGDRGRSTPPPLDPRAVILMRALAGPPADLYAEDYLCAHLRKVLRAPAAAANELWQALQDPVQSLRAFFGHHVFARRGRDRDELAKAALMAIDVLVAEAGPEQALEAKDGTALWERFVAACADRGVKPNEPQNRGPVQGMLELAQEIHRLTPGGSLASWVADGIEEAGRIEPQYLRIVDIRGIGPKSSSMFIRDVVFLAGSEDAVEPAERLYLHPVDRWLRAIVPYVVPEPDLEDPPDWIVAGKIAKYTRRARVSGVRFNMGVTYFGQRVVHDLEHLDRELLRLLSDEIERLRATDPAVGLLPAGLPG
jgi:hypothetical protein